MEALIKQMIAAQEANTAELRALRRDLREMVRARVTQLHPADRTKLQVLLPAIAAGIGDRLFTSKELIVFAESELSGAEQFRAVLEQAISTIDDNAGRRLGKLLARAAYLDVGEWRVEQIGSDRDGAIWKVCGLASLSEFQRVPNSHRPLPAPPGGPY